jgi:hypothetical protein
MAFLQWLITESIALLKFYWSKRPKPYVRISLALVVGGSAILSASPVIVALQLLKIIVAPTSADSPWWMDPATGFSLVLLGVVIFVSFYWVDPDRRKATPPAPSLTITPGNGWTFEQTAIAIGMLEKKPVVLENFSATERGTILRSQQISAKTAAGLLKDLGALAIGSTITDYDVVPQESTIIVRRK